MKKRLAFAAMLLAVCLLFSGCLTGFMFIPDSGSVGEPKTFEKDGISITLTDRFTEQVSQRGFYAYYVTDFSGVVVLREEFSLQEGLAGQSLEEYVSGVIANNGHTDIEPQNRDGLWYYSGEEGATTNYSFSYKGSDAFWIVQFMCMTSDAARYEDQIFLWASSVEVE